MFLQFQYSDQACEIIQIINAVHNIQTTNTSFIILFIITQENSPYSLNSKSNDKGVPAFKS